MWQAEESQRPTTHRPDPWPEIRRRLERRLVSAYCSMRFDGHTRQSVMDDLGLAPEEVETAIRRGAEVYGHDIDDALSWVGLPKTDRTRRPRGQSRRPSPAPKSAAPKSEEHVFHPVNRLRACSKIQDTGSLRYLWRRSAARSGLPQGSETRT